MGHAADAHSVRQALGVENREGRRERYSVNDRNVLNSAYRRTEHASELFGPVVVGEHHHVEVQVGDPPIWWTVL
jgi:hypothetical protein